MDTFISFFPKNIPQSWWISPIRPLQSSRISGYLKGLEWFKILSNWSAIHEMNSASVISSGSDMKLSSVIVISDKLSDWYRVRLVRRWIWMDNHYSSSSNRLPFISKYWVSNDVKSPRRVLRKCRFSSNTNKSIERELDKLPARHKTDLGLIWIYPEASLRIRAFVDNLFDARNFRSLSVGSLSNNYRLTGRLLPTRSFGLDITKTFGGS